MRSTVRAVLLCGLSLLLAGLAPAWGELSPNGKAIPILDGGGCTEDWLDVAVLPGEELLAVWTETSTSWFDPDVTILARRFAADGTPQGEPGEIETDSRAERTRVAVNAAGRTLIAWHDRATGAVVAAFFDRDLKPLGARRILSQSAQVPYGLDVAVLANGGFGVLMARPHPVLWRFSPEGEEVDVTPLLPESTPVRSLDGLRLSAQGEEGAAAVWSVDADGVFSVEARLFQPGGASPWIEVASFTDNLPFRPLNPPQPSIAGDRSGAVLVTWRGVVQEPGSLKPALLARGFGADGAPLTDAFRLDGADETFLSAPDVVADGAGGFIAVWQTQLNVAPRGHGLSLRRLSPRGELLEPPLRVPSDLANFEQPVAAIGATGATGAIGATGAAGAIGATGAAGGSGRLVVARQGGFEQGIPEEICDKFGALFAWTFDAAAADLSLQEGRFRVEVEWTDHAGQSGAGRPVALTPDSGYFWFFGPDNVELMLKILDGRGLNGHFWVFYASLSDVAYTITVTDTVSGAVKTYTNPAGQLASRADTAAFPADGTSVAAPGSLLPGGSSSGLLLGDRFEVEVTWTNPATGISGIGRGVKLTDDSGYLWFFGPNNIELVVKVLDGRPVNGRFWVFYGALSNVEYTLRVRDTVTGQLREYHNPPGQLASRADTAAFPLPE